MIAKPNDSNKIDTKVYKITKSSTKQQKVFFFKKQKNPTTNDEILYKYNYD